LYLINDPDLIELIKKHSRDDESVEKFLTRAITEWRRVQNAIDEMAVLSDALCPDPH
jgi:hypothetical protein